MLALPPSIGGALAAPRATPLAANRNLPLRTIATRRAEPAKFAVDSIAGRYAVMREKHDTGCMITLDSSRTRDGQRAQLAPGCRDQGIVVFDPSSWQISRGELVLTARAGHRTMLEHHDDGSWSKAATSGSKPLGLKKL